MGWPKAPLPSPKLVWNGFSLDSGSSARISSIFCCGGCLYCNYISKPKLGHSRMSVDRTNLKSVLARLKAMRTSIPEGERVVQEHYAEDYGALLAIVQASLSEDLAFFELPPSTTVRVKGLSPGGIWVEHFSSKLLQLIAHVEAVLGESSEVMERLGRSLIRSAMTSCDLAAQTFCPHRTNLTAPSIRLPRFWKIVFARDQGPMPV